jgi:hypothetical protein
MERTIDKIDNLQKRIERFQKFRDENPELDFSDLEIDALEDEELQEAMQVGGKLTYNMAHLDVESWMEDLKSDKAQLHLLYLSGKDISVERDAKLAELKQLIARKVNHPKTNKLGEPNRKVLVFTAFADTADYLYNALREWATKHLNIHSAMVTGGTMKNKTTFGKNDFNHILTNFSPSQSSAPKSHLCHKRVRLTYSSELIVFLRGRTFRIAII